MGVNSHVDKAVVQGLWLRGRSLKIVLQAARRQQNHTGVGHMAEQVAQQLYSAMMKRKGGRGMEL